MEINSPTFECRLKYDLITFFVLTKCADCVSNFVSVIACNLE